MKYTTAILAASAVAVKAQFTIGPGNPAQSITCTGSNPNGNYCASDSLGSPIIIRCKEGVGEAGNCSDNLSGEPPADVLFGECYQTSPTAGDAACSKNCVVYPDGGTPFTLPAALCTPKAESTSSSAQSTSALSTSTTTTTAFPSLTGSNTTTSTGTSVYTSANVVVTQIFTTTFCPTSTLTTVIIPSGTGFVSHPGNGTSGSGSGSGSPPKPIITGTGSSPTGSGSGSSSGGSSNGTVTSAGGNGGFSSSPTAIPVGPTTAAPSSFTGGAIANSASFALAAVGLAVAFFL